MGEVGSWTLTFTEAELTPPTSFARRLGHWTRLPSQFEEAALATQVERLALEEIAVDPNLRDEDCSLSRHILEANLGSLWPRVSPSLSSHLYLGSINEMIR